MNKKILIIAIVAFVGYLGLAANFSSADTIGTFDFESPTYTTGNIHGQNGWTKSGSYDSEVVSVATFANASGFGFGNQALRISNAVTSGAFGDQTFSPGLVTPAVENSVNNHFEASFSIGSTQASQQTGLFLSISPDDGNGSRMSYVGFDDQSDGIHVIFYDVTNPGPLGTVASFNQSDVATINRTEAHTIKFEIDLVTGPANDVVKLYVDNSLVHTGTSWEDYYRYDPEQNGNGNIVPSISHLLFRAGGTAVPANSGNGYLFDNINLTSGSIVIPTPTVSPSPSVSPTPNPFAAPAECSQIAGLGAPIVGTNGSNNINGTSGNDLIFGLGGSDRIDGKGGDDCIVAGAGSDLVFGKNGNDVILGGAGSDDLRGENDNDSLYGEGGSDSLRGGNGTDTLTGGSGSDQARGEGGQDTCTAESEISCEL